MRRLTASRFCLAMVLASAACAQVPVCDLFKDLGANDGRQVLVAGDLILSTDIAVIGAEDCDNEYVADHFVWPRGLRLNASDKVPGEQLSQLKQVAAAVDRYRKEGKAFTTSAVFEGRLRLGESNGFPAELRFDSVSNLKVDILPDAKDLPVIPICDLFQGLPDWKGQRIAVREKWSVPWKVRGWLGDARAASIRTATVGRFP